MVDKTTWDPNATPEENLSQEGRGSIQDASTAEMDRIRAQLEKLL